MSKAGKLPEEEKLEQIYDEYDEFITTTGSRPILHLPIETGDDVDPDDAAVCTLQNRGDYRFKQSAVFPPGTRRFCKGCLDVWDDEQDHVEETTFAVRNRLTGD